MHHHRVKHETFFIVKGRVEMELAGRTFVMNQGDTCIVDQDAPAPIHRPHATAWSWRSSKPDLVDDSIFEDELDRIIFG